MKPSYQDIMRIGFIGLLVICVCTGCSGVGQKMEKWSTSVSETFKETLSFGDSDEDERKNSDIFYIHKSKYSWETLEIVADWYTGDSGNWKKLAEVNPDVEPRKIEAGSEIFIPVKMLKTRESLPENYASLNCQDCYRHKVRWPGESMSLIARWYTGSSNNWRKLARANPRLNPNRIRKGDVISIPPALLKTREPMPEKVAARYTADYFAHKVKQDGEKIEAIAKWYTGKAANWKVIARANPKINPNHLAAGNEIYIPSNLIKTRSPLPNVKAVQAADTPEPQPANAKETKPAAEEEEIKIFGPKQFPKS